MKYLLMAIVAFIITLPTISYAEQVIIKQRFINGYETDMGYAYTIDVEDEQSCMNAAKNISNLYRHSKASDIETNKFYIIRFICINETGKILNDGAYYQLPFSLDRPNNLTCMRSSMFGYYLNDDCDDGNFITKAVLIARGTLYGYITSFDYKE